MSRLSAVHVVTITDNYGPELTVVGVFTTDAAAQAALAAACTRRGWKPWPAADELTGWMWESGDASRSCWGEITRKELESVLTQPFPPPAVYVVTITAEDGPELDVVGVFTTEAAAQAALRTEYNRGWWHNVGEYIPKATPGFDVILRQGGSSIYFVGAITRKRLNGVLTCWGTVIKSD